MTDLGWSDPRVNQIQTGGNSGRESLFIKLETSARVRIVGAPVFFEKHWSRTATGKDTTIKCPGKAICPVCAKGDPNDKARLKAILPVLERASGKCKLLEIPQIVIAQLKGLQEGEWGELSQYDVEVKKTKTGKKTDYQVIPQPKAPISLIDQAEVRRFFETVDFKKYAAPHTVEEVIMLLNGQSIFKQADQQPAHNYQHQTYTPPQAQYVQPQMQYQPPQAAVPQAPAYQPMGVVPLGTLAPTAVPQAPAYQPPQAPAYQPPQAQYANTYTPPQAPVLPPPVVPPVVPQAIPQSGVIIDDNLFNQFLAKK